MRVGQILSRLYHNLREGRYDTAMVLHHSDVYFVRAALLAENWDILEGGPPEAVRALVEDMSLEDIATILREEGLLAYYEYGIPRWYARKWLNASPSRQQAIKNAKLRINNRGTSSS